MKNKIIVTSTIIKPSLLFLASTNTACVSQQYPSYVSTTKPNALHPSIENNSRRKLVSLSTKNCFYFSRRNISARTITTSTTVKRTSKTSILMATSSSSSSPNMEEVRDKKKALRKKIRSLLKVMTPQQIQLQSQQVWDRLSALPAYQDAKTIGLFLSMPSGEINTDPLIRQAVLKDNKELFIPRVGLDFEKCDMDLVLVQDKSTEEKLFYEFWPTNKWGIPEPPLNTENEQVAGPGDIDLLIVPGLAFDTKGGRLGQGKGYYDRFISRIRDNGTKKPLLVAVGMEPQFLVDDFIPTMDHDFIMDVVVTPQSTIFV